MKKIPIGKNTNSPDNSHNYGENYENRLKSVSSNKEESKGIGPINYKIPPANYSKNKKANLAYKKIKESEPNENNLNIGGKDLEVIKENHSEFSNSNSVIESFRNKRKSNISSSGNNSGDQHIIHGAQEMINEEDEEDLENDTTSFRGPKKLNRYDLEEDKHENRQETIE